MTHVTLRGNFSDCSADYRVLSVSTEYLREIKCRVGAASERKCGGGSVNRGESVQLGQTTLMTLKGGNQLLLCDDDQTFRVRRVEYSNTLLFAEEQPIEAHSPSAGAEARVTPSTLSGAGGEKKHVVVCSAERVFETKPAVPYCEAVQHLLATPLTMRELDSIDTAGIGYGEHVTVEGHGVLTNATSEGLEPPQRFYTFPQLVALSRCSARELANTLFEMGAVVFNGFVRLLQPSLTRSALQTALSFFEALDNPTWEAVMDQLCPSAYPHVVMQSVRAAYGKPLLADIAPRCTADLLLVPKVLQALAASVLLADDEECAPDAGSGKPQTNSANGVRQGEALFPALDFDAFYEAWTNLIPYSLFESGNLPPRSERTQLMKLLHGFVVVVREGSGDNYAGARALWVPSSVLSTELQLRIRQLFEIHPGRWEADELRPYVEPLLDPGLVFEHVIVRFAKEYRAPNRPVTYGSL